MATPARVSDHLDDDGDHDQDGDHASDHATAASPATLRKLQEDVKINTARVDLWLSSPEREWYIGRRWRTYAGLSLALALAITAIMLVIVNPDNFRRYLGALFGGLAILTAGISTIPYFAAIRAFRLRKRALATYNLDVALDAVCDKDPMPLNGLFNLNRRQLNAYLETTKRQQSAAFRLTWGASLAAFGVLVAGVVLSFRHGNTGNSRYVVAGLTSLGALLSAFLGKTFFDGHVQAMKQMNWYYLEPSLSGRLLAAERAVNVLDPSHKAKYTDDIVHKLVTWEPPIEDLLRYVDGANGAASDGPAAAPATNGAKKTAAKKTAAKKTAAKKAAAKKAAAKKAAAAARAQKRTGSR